MAWEGLVWQQTFYFSVWRWESTELPTSSRSQNSHYLQNHSLSEQNCFSDLAWGMRFIQIGKRGKHQRATTPEIGDQVEKCSLKLRIWIVFWHFVHPSGPPSRSFFNPSFSVLSLHIQISKSLCVYAPDSLPIQRGSRQAEAEGSDLAPSQPWYCFFLSFPGIFSLSVCATS